MFRLFRKIRGDLLSQAKTREYLLYTIGEIVLVVAGILIALQINNWNEERIEQQQIREYAHALIGDLERDLAMLEPIMTQIELLRAKANGLADYVRGKSIEQVNNLDLFYLTSTTGYRSYAWNQAAIDQLKSAGALRQMKNRGLVNKISAYDALTRHLDEDYAHDMAIRTEARRLITRIVDQNYPGIHQTDSLHWNRPYSFPPEELHDAYKDAELQLLTKDIADIRELVNIFLDLRGSVRARVDTELPRLRQNAEELIEILKSEYPE